MTRPAPATIRFWIVAVLFGLGAVALCCGLISAMDHPKTRGAAQVAR